MYPLKLTMISEPLFIWAYLPGESAPVVAGKLQVAATPTGHVGSFTYGKSYLGNPNALALDPVALPLSAQFFSFTALKGIPGVILDACPDRWGIRAINRLIGEQPYPAGYLLLNDPGRVGNLAFSLRADLPPVELKSREFALTELLVAAEALEKDDVIDHELIKALHPGTGGARPKCNIVFEDAVWIGKFPSADDPLRLSMPRLEHATMQLAKACGIDVAETRLISVGEKDVCLVRRFDRHIGCNLTQQCSINRLAFISARSVFYADTEFRATAMGSYARLARWLPRYAISQDGALQLFRRMVFNAAVRNTDDHELNHGLVYSPEQRAFQLSPAYDLLPSLHSHRISQHALLMGDNADGTLENLVSACAAFGLTRDEALKIIWEIAQIVQAQWDSVLYACGFGDDAISRLRHCFAPLPLRRE